MTLEQMGLTPEQADKLFKLAAKKLGISPEQLALQVKQGRFDYLLSTPQAKSMIRDLKNRQH